MVTLHLVPETEYLRVRVREFLGQIMGPRPLGYVNYVLLHTLPSSLSPRTDHFALGKGATLGCTSVEEILRTCESVKVCHKTILFLKMILRM